MTNRQRNIFMAYFQEASDTMERYGKGKMGQRLSEAAGRPCSNCREQRD